MLDRPRIVFLSSVAAGLEPYRDDACRAIEKIGCHCLRMEDFGARPVSSRQECQGKIERSDVFIAIVGHRYGSVLAEDNVSYSEFEYNLARARNTRMLIFMAVDEFPVPANLIEPEHLRVRQAEFRRRIRNDHQLAFFASSQELATLIVQGICNLLTDAPSAKADAPAEGRTTSCPVSVAFPESAQTPNSRAVTRLLFPYITNVAGWDTGVAIANTTDDPFGSEKQWGTCTVHYYGIMSDGRAVPTPQSTSVVSPGQLVSFLISAGGVLGSRESAAGFQGYIIVECEFARARGYAFISPCGATGPGTGYLAELLPI